MTTLRSAAERALEALNHLKTREPVETEIAALRAALAQPEQEPLTDVKVWELMRDNDPSVYEAFRLCERAHGIGNEE